MTTKSLYTRLMSKADKTNQCWLWTAAKQGGGYGVIKVNGIQRNAHRVAYELCWGKVPPEMCVLHVCDTPSCVNPHHLIVGTSADNARDRQQKGRGGFYGWPRGKYAGEKNPNSKLTDAQTAEIAQSTETYAALAKRYGVTPVRIGQIRRAARAANTGLLFGLHTA